VKNFDLSCVNTASHDNQKKINSWVSFAFPYGYGVLLGGFLVIIAGKQS